MGQQDFGVIAEVGARNDYPAAPGEGRNVARVDYQGRMAADAALLAGRDGQSNSDQGREQPQRRQRKADNIDCRQQTGDRIEQLRCGSRSRRGFGRVGNLEGRRENFNRSPGDGSRPGALNEGHRREQSRNSENRNEQQAVEPMAGQAMDAGQAKHCPEQRQNCTRNQRVDEENGSCHGRYSSPRSTWSMSRRSSSGVSFSSATRALTTLFIELLK